MSAAGFRNIVDPVQAGHFRKQGWWGDATVSDFVRDHALQQPHKPAYITPDRQLTYAELDACSDRVAAALVSTGAEPGDRVAVLLPDGPTIHAVFLGAERAGLTVVGIGARAGDRELRHLLDKTRASLLVTHGAHRGADHIVAFAALRRAGVPLTHHVVVPRFEASDDRPR